MAGRFKFRLESLLKVRHSLKEEAQRHLARMLAQQEQAQAALAELRKTHDATVEGRRMAPRQVVDLALWEATERFLRVLEGRILQAAQELRTAQARVASARQALLKAHQEHRMLERLKERRQEQHRLETLAAEAREADEIAVLRHHLPPASSL